MTGPADLYLLAVIGRYRVPESPSAAPNRVLRELRPRLRRWGGERLEAVRISGSYAKGSAIRNASLFPGDVDVDLLLSLSPEAVEPLAAWQESLVREFREYQARVANVAVRLLVGPVRVDLVVARRREGSEEHTLWQALRGTWLRTNVAEQIRYVKASRRRDEILAMKIWRRRNALYFPSYLLELAVIEALGDGEAPGAFSARFLKVLRFLVERFPESVLRDPANASNVVSDLLSAEEKWRIAHAAERGLRAGGWEDIV